MRVQLLASVPRGKNTRVKTSRLSKRSYRSISPPSIPINPTFHIHLARNFHTLTDRTLPRSQGVVALFEIVLDGVVHSAQPLPVCILIMGTLELFSCSTLSQTLLPRAPGERVSKTFAGLSFLRSSRVSDMRDKSILKSSNRATSLSSPKSRAMDSSLRLPSMLS